MSNNSQAVTTRSSDFMQVLVNLQQGVQAAAPSNSPVYLGAIETDASTKTDTSSIAAAGPPYYSQSAAIYIGAANAIICGFFAAS
jgi:hypothetical protein